MRWTWRQRHPGSRCISTSKRRLHSPREHIFGITYDEGLFSMVRWLCSANLSFSGAAGYVIALSGGIDSCATSITVYSMCQMVLEACQKGSQKVIEDVRRITKQEPLPKSVEGFCHAIFHTLYLGMSQQSSEETRRRARRLSEAIGAFHLSMDIDEVYNAQRNLVVNSLGFEPKFRVHGGSEAENLALQSMAARLPLP
jgi:NAD+ synthase (glutamine-hydrolysing)